MCVCLCVYTYYQNKLYRCIKVSINIVSSHNRFSIFVCYNDITYYLIWYTVRIEYLCHLSSMYGIENFGEIDEKDSSYQIFYICAFDNSSNRKYLPRGRSISSKTVLIFS